MPLEKHSSDSFFYVLFQPILEIFKTDRRVNGYELVLCYFRIDFLGIGIAFFIGLGSNWIEEWSKMPKEEKSKIRIDTLSKNMGCDHIPYSHIIL